MLPRYQYDGEVLRLDAHFDAQLRQTPAHNLASLTGNRNEPSCPINYAVVTWCRLEVCFPLVADRG